MSITFHANNLRILRRVKWPLSRGVSVLTGANASGKTTTLFGLKLLRSAFERGLPDAVALTLGGSYNLRHRDAEENEQINVGLTSEELSWNLQLLPRGSSVDYLAEETLTLGGDVIFQRDSLGNFFYRGKRQDLSPSASERPALRWVADRYPEDKDVAQLSQIARRINIFYDPDLRGLRDSGSKATEDRHLRSNGRNVFTMLRKWRDKREDAARFHFVEEGMRAAFPGAFSSLDFEAGAAVTGHVLRRDDDHSTPVANEANGILAMLVLLSNLAGAEDGGVVGIDEPETALHPFAIRSFVRDARAWADQRNLTVVLTTHSPVLLDEFNPEPERVFAMEHDRETLPLNLDDLRGREWLAHYTLGALYAGGQFSANEDG